MPPEFTAPSSPPPRHFPILPLSALLLSLALYTASLFLPVWDTRTDHGGEWALIPGFLPLMIGFLGLLVLCPAWFANLLLIPLCITLFKGRRIGFWISLVALALAATAYVLPAIYGDNEAAVIVHRKIGFYLWLATFFSLALGHALLIDRNLKPSPLVRILAIAILLILIVVLQLSLPVVRVTPLEESLRDPANMQPFFDVLARNPPQAEKDAALPWVMASDLHKYRDGPGPQRIEKLIAAGANINQADKYGITPLMRAVQTRGTEPLVDTLIRAGADVNARDYRGQTILDIARETFASPQCIQSLLDAGAKSSK